MLLLFSSFEFAIVAPEKGNHNKQPNLKANQKPMTAGTMREEVFFEFNYVEKCINLSFGQNVYCHCVFDK